MSDHPDVQGRTITHTLRVTGGRTEPAHGLYQPSFSLGEADFLRLKQASPVLAAIGGSILSFGLVYALPILANYLVKKTPIDKIEAWISSGTIIVGSLFVLASVLVSRERRKVLRRVKEHFENNPAKLAYRVRTDE